MEKNSIVNLSLILVLVFLCLGSGLARGESQTATLEILGVPEEMVAGRYDPQEGIFSADVSEIKDALIQVKFEAVQIFGQKMNWQTKDNHLKFTNTARLTKEDFELTADIVEYFGDEEKLIAEGNVIVITADATVYSDHLLYNEKTDEALFTGEVRVVFDDGTLEGNKFLMLLEKSELQFFGDFQGEFATDSK